MASSSSFASQVDEDAFFTTIREVMQMGMPESDDEKLTWWWKRDKTYDPASPSGTPYDLTATPDTDEPGNATLADADPADQFLIVDYVLEFSSRPAGSQTTVFGEIDTSRAEVTLIDTDWEKVNTADYATIGDTHYNIQFAGPKQGFFSRGIVAVFLEAEDET